MPTAQITEFLDANHIGYSTIPHPPTYTALETAESAHVPGNELAKTVLVTIDGRLAMAVVPAGRMVDVELLAQVAGAKRVRVADEREFRSAFPDCEVGAMPPLGNLYHLDVYADSELSEDLEIAFNAGTHTELIRMPFADFDRVVSPTVADISRPR